MPAFHSPRFSPRFALPAAALALAAACSGCSQRGAAASPARDQSAPGPVALAYTQSLISGDVRGAEDLVLPKDRGALANVPMPKGMDVHGYDLRVGSATVKDASASVVLTGKICNMTGPPASSRPASPAPSTGSCISNADVNSNNPLFRVALIRAADQKWYVSFPGVPASTASARASG